MSFPGVGPVPWTQTGLPPGWAPSVSRTVATWSPLVAGTDSAYATRSEDDCPFVKAYLDFFLTVCL